MARARMYSIESAEPVGDMLRERFNVCYSGVDVPGGIAFDSLSVDIDLELNPSQILTVYSDAIRAKALEKGFTVPSNKVVLNSLSKQ